MDGSGGRMKSKWMRLFEVYGLRMAEIGRNM